MVTNKKAPTRQPSYKAVFIIYKNKKVQWAKLLFTLVHHLCSRYNDEHVGSCHLRWYNLQNNGSAHRLPMEWRARLFL